jgi:3-phosphoshikimate 1-carboxyvinyltransferase
MKGFVIRSVSGIRAKLSLSGDKSISHRAVILAAIAKGKTRIENFPANKDCLSTVSAFRRLGIRISFKKKGVVEVSGKGLHGLSRSGSPIFIGESGTTFRLLAGLLSAQDFPSRLTAAESLSARPMRRITLPLRAMGAKISGRLRGKEEYPPVSISPGHLKPITYKLPVASAQVKSAILLAGLYAKGSTCVIEPVKTRDHTERMLCAFKAAIKTKGNKICLSGMKELISPARCFIPADISSAAFFMVAAAIVPGSRVIIKDVSLNSSRTGILKVLKRMGAAIKVSPRIGDLAMGSEPRGDVIVESSRLKSTIIKSSEVPSLIDELPILMVAASLARGKTVIEGARELRVKETDRILSMSTNLKKVGADISVTGSGSAEKIIIRGVSRLKGAAVRSFGDHRTAMSMAVAGLAAVGTTKIDDISCIDKSFPDFTKILSSLAK